MNKKLFSIVVALLVVFVGFNAQAQKKYFSGIYTIGGSNANYQNIQKALSDLYDSKSEVIGRVTFNIRPGEYKENLTFKPYAGASARNFVVFKSETGKASDVVIKHPGDNTLYNNHVVRFEGCSFITLQDLTIENERVITASNQFASVIHFTYNRDTKKPSEYNTINRCILKLDSVFTVFNGNTIPIVASDINNTSVGEVCANYNNITNNSIYGGAFGIRLLGKSTVAPGRGNKISGNKFYKCYSGMDFDYNNVPLIAYNQINCRVNPFEAQFGIRVRNTAGNFSYHGNQIKDYGTFGIFLLNITGGAAAYVYNNMILGNSKSAYSRGIHIEKCTSIQFYHNSIYYNNTYSTEKACFVVENSTNPSTAKISVKNNIFYSIGGAVPYIVKNVTSIDTSNYNCYYNATNLSELGVINGSLRNGGLTQLRLATTKDRESVNRNPFFASPTSLRIDSRKLIKKAAVIKAVMFDFENQPRDPEIPDFGADEVIRSAVDLEVFHLDKNFVPKEGINMLPVVIKNDGLLSLNGNKILVSYKVDNGAFTTPEEFTLQTLSKPYSKQTVLLSQPWTIPSVGQYTLILRVSPPVPNDNWQENDYDTLQICVGLNGNYTIGGPAGNKNFPTFAAAIAAFGCGLGGPTVFDVYPGTYPSFSLPVIKGVSASNTLTLKSVTGNAADVIVENNTASQNNTNHFVVQMNGASFVRIKNFTIKNNSTSSYASGFHICDGSESIIIDSCIVQVPKTTNIASFIYPVVMSQQVKIDSGAVFNNITISNSKLTHGVAGIQMFGRNVGSRSQNNSAINNKIDSAILYGISTNFVNVGELSKNVIIMSDTANVASEGIRILFSKFNTILSQNYTKNVGSRGLNLTSVEGISGLTIANNMFAGGYKTTGLGAGIYLNEVNKVNLTHNSVYYDGVSTTQPDFSSAFFVAAGSNISLYNNIFYNPTGGYAYFVTNVTSIREANNNIYYTDNNPSSGLFAYLGSDKLNLTALRATVPGIETSSLEINPQFVSNLDLHTTNVNLEGKGLYLSSINKDYDGQDRNPLGTDIGADEFIIHNKDLAVLDIQPIVFSTDPNSISVKLMNLGSTSLNGSTIKLQYSSNGTTWLPAAGESYTIGAGGNASLATPYSTASFTFSTPFNATANNTYPFYIRILPSDRIIGDPVTKNDTVNLTICTGLKAGVYTIGGTNPTYPDFNSAVNAIACGVTGPVVFNVRPGTYDERFTIGNPKNTSAVNSITFKAENNDSSSVIIKNVGVSSNTTRNVIRLNRSSFINLKHLTIQNASNSIVGSAGIQITSESRNINITNCRIELDTLTTSPNIFGITTSDSANLTVFGKGGSNIRISKNHIIGGNLGVSIKGSNQYIRETGIIIDSNILEYVAQTAISTSNTDASSISNNKIIMRKNQSSSTGLSVTINRGDTKITNNVIYNAATTGVTFNDVLPINWVLFANNMIGGNFRLNTEGVGVTLNKVTAMKIYNNSILYDGNSVFGTGLKVDNDSRNIRLINNTIANTSTGFCFTYINQLSIDTSDNNNFFTKGVLFARVEGTDYLNFDEYRDARLTDEKSVSVDPDYFTNTNLHITNTFLDGGALPLKEVIHDIDGELRNVEFPDIGADEFLVRGDVEIVSIDSPLPSPEVYPSKVPVTITVRNKGLSKISGLNVKYYVDNIEIANEVIPVDEPYKPMLPTDLQTYEFLTPFEPTASGIYNMRVEAYLPDDIDLTNNEKNISFRSSVSSIVDGEVSAFVSPANSSVNQLTNVRVLIKNAGTVAIKDFNVNYTLRGGLSGVINKTEYFGTDSILPLQTGSFIFTDLIDCDNQFDRFLSVYISDLGNDINQQNDTLVMYIKPHAPCFSAVELDPNQFMLTAPWPNPTASELNYDINVLQPTSLNIEIIDVLGHIIKTVNYHQINKGVNHLNMDVSNLAPGVYYSRVSIDGKFYTDRVVITR